MVAAPLMQTPLASKGCVCANYYSKYWGGLYKESLFLEPGQNVAVRSCNAMAISELVLVYRGAGGGEVDGDPARSLSSAGLVWPRRFKPSSVFRCDCPTQPTLSPKTQWVNEEDPCWWCKCHATRGRKDHTITLGAFRSRQENHTNKCSQVRKN